MEVDLQHESQFEGEIGESEMDTSGIDIDNVDCIPNVSINSFEPETLPDVNDQSIFFLTQASERIFSDMKNSKFFSCLRSAPCWKLYVSELMFGVLFYEAPWNETFQSNFLLRKLKDMERIIVLQKNVAVDVPLSPVTQTVTTCRSLNVTHMRHGRVTQMFEFEIKKADETTVRCTHMGTSILDDIISSGKYNVGKPCPGFPKIFKEFQPNEASSSYESDTSDSQFTSSLSSMSLSSSSSSSSSSSYLDLPPSAVELTKSFSAVLEDIREALQPDKYQHFKIVTSGADKLVSLWYMKHLSEEFHSKVHVDQHLFTFIQRFLPDFEKAFSPTASIRCRFHFNCCDSWSKTLDSGCVIGVNPRFVNTNFICIGYWQNKLPRNFRIPKTSHCIPYIHEVIYDF